jgi:hypothetical protein
LDVVVLLLLLIDKSFLVDKRFDWLKFVWSSDEDDKDERLLILEDGDVEEDDEVDEGEEDDIDIRRIWEWE